MKKRKEVKIERVHCENCNSSGMNYDFIFDPETELYFCRKKCGGRKLVYKHLSTKSL